MKSYEPAPPLPLSLTPIFWNGVPHRSFSLFPFPFLMFHGFSPITSFLCSKRPFWCHGGVTAVSRFWEVPQTHVIIGVRGVFLFGVTGVTVA